MKNKNLIRSLSRCQQYLAALKSGKRLGLLDVRNDANLVSINRARIVSFLKGSRNYEPKYAG